MTISISIFSFRRLTLGPYSEASRVPAAERLKISADIANKVVKDEISTADLLSFITDPKKQVKDINERIISAIALLEKLDNKKEYLTQNEIKKILATILDEYNYPCEGLDLTNKAVIDHNHLNFKIYLCRIMTKHSSKRDLTDEEFKSFGEFLNFLGVLKDIYGSFNLIDISPLREDLKKSDFAIFTV